MVTTCPAQIGCKIKSAQNLLNLAHLIFQICQSGFRCQKWFLWNIYQLPGQIRPKIEIALKFMFDISGIPILTTRSDKSFI